MIFHVLNNENGAYFSEKAIQSKVRTGSDYLNN